MKDKFNLFCIDPIECLNEWDACNERGGEMYGCFSVPEWCDGICAEASESLVRFYDSRGIAARAIDVVHIETGAPHTVVLVNGLIVVDFTYRQFEADAEVPSVFSLADFDKLFRRLDQN